LLDMVSVAPPRTDAGARLLCGIIQQPAHLLGSETGGAPGSRGRAHGPNQVVGFFHSRTDSLHGPHGDVVAERHRPQEMRPSDAKLLPRSQRRGYHRAAWMRSSGGEI